MLNYVFNQKEYKKSLRNDCLQFSSSIQSYV